MSKQKLTSLQLKFTLEDAKAITKILHPDITDAQLQGCRIYHKYTWILISFGAGALGRVEIGIDNHQTDPIISGAVSHDYIKQQLKAGACEWHIWRFYGDSKIENTSGLHRDINHNKAVEYLISRGFKTPTAEEFIYHYFTD